MNILKKAPPKKAAPKKPKSAAAKPRKPKLGFGAKIGIISVNGDITKPIPLWR
jgi:hypothetical protein